MNNTPMAAKKVHRWACVCNKCNHEWVSRDEILPAICPNKTCHTPNWNNDRPLIPRQRKTVAPATQSSRR